MADFLSEDPTLIFVDVPAYGQSDAPSSVPTMEEIGSCIARVTDSEKISKAKLCGFHTGGKIAVAAALIQPSVFESVVICGKTHSIIPDHLQRNQAMKEQIASRKPDYVLIMMETFSADDVAAQTGRQLLYEANFAYDLAGGVSRLECDLSVIEFTSDDEDAAHGRQARALAEKAKSGTAFELPQIEAMGTDLYSGAKELSQLLMRIWR